MCWIEKLNYYEWARFLERVNEEAVATKLLDKIDESAKRNNLSAYRQILYEEFESKNCFYCGRPLQPGKIDVDHFIPSLLYFSPTSMYAIMLITVYNIRQKSSIWQPVILPPITGRAGKNQIPQIIILDK